MLKKILLSVSALAFATLLYSGTAYSFCGGTVANMNDCNGNSEHYTSSCCQPGYRVHGIVYNDQNKGKDTVNAIVAYCRKYKGNEWSIPNKDQLQGGGPLVKIQCKSNEVMSALGCSDISGKDRMDGCVIQCTNPTTKVARWVNPNGDIGHPGAIVTVNLPNRIQGIGYKKEHANTDETDCATVSYKHQPIVQ